MRHRAFAPPLGFQVLKIISILRNGKTSSMESSKFNNGASEKRECNPSQRISEGQEWGSVRVAVGVLFGHLPSWPQTHPGCVIWREIVWGNMRRPDTTYDDKIINGVTGALGNLPWPIEAN